MPESTSSTSPCGPRSACPKKRAGSWGWSKAGACYSGRVRPDIDDAGDVRLALRTIPEVVDVALAVWNSGDTSPAAVGFDACALAEIPDVASVQKGRLRMSLSEVTDLT